MAVGESTETAVEVNTGLGVSEPGGITVAVIVGVRVAEGKAAVVVNVGVRVTVGEMAVDV